MLDDEEKLVVVCPLIWLGRRTTSFAVAAAPLLAPSPLLGPEAKRHP